MKLPAKNKQPQTSGRKSKSVYEYVGAIHIHSNFSDGLRSIPEIAEIAKECNLDFLLFADHMTLEPLKKGMERWFGPVLSIIGYEINDTDNKNHYLVFGLKDILSPELKPYEYVRVTKEKGAVGFIAHPDEKRSSMPEIPPYPWTAWDVKGYDGIEVWNHSSEWLEKLNKINKYFHVLHPSKYLRGPEPETLRRWDDLNKTRAVSGIGGLDAHAYPYRIGPLTVYIFRYKVLFHGIRTHVIVDNQLTENIEQAKMTVLTALKRARCFISNYRWGDARGFRFTAHSHDCIHHMGETVTLSKAKSLLKSVDFSVTTPLPGKITLLNNGSPVTHAEGDSLLYSTAAPGSYRIEVKRKNKPWIYSNHIRLRGEKP
ncbi:histidinol-phosphatase [Candidatus Latescibacterota bacterium]